MFNNKRFSTTHLSVPFTGCDSLPVFEEEPLTPPLRVVSYSTSPLAEDTSNTRPSFLNSIVNAIGYIARRV